MLYVMSWQKSNMFSGIIRQIGEVRTINTHSSGVRLSVEIGEFANTVKLGDSIAHNGVCLTVAEIKRSVATYDLLEETCKKTTLGNLQLGKKLNLELSLKLGDAIDGHLVYGHVDEIGEITKIEKTNSATRITVQPSLAFMNYIAPQGAIAVDGVSLTIADSTKEVFTVSLVPYTVQHTAFCDSVVGDRVNLEADMMAKYVQSLDKKRCYE